MNVAELFVRLSADASGVRKGTQQAARDLGVFEGAARKLGAALAATFAAKELAQFAQSSVREFAQAQAIWERLAATVDATGTSFRGVAGDIETAAKSMQAATRFGDEEFAQALQSLTIQTGNVSKAMDAMGLAADLAAAKGMGLEEAANLLGKAMAGNTTQLKRLFPALKESTDLFGDLQKVVQGMAERDAKTLEGRLRQLNNAWSDFKEAIGGVLVGGTEMGGLAERLSGNLQDLTAFIDRNRDGLSAMLAPLRLIVTAFEGWVRLIGLAVEGLQKLIDKQRSLPKLQGSIAAVLGGPRAAPAAPAAPTGVPQAIEGITLTVVRSLKTLGEALDGLRDGLPSVKDIATGAEIAAANQARSFAGDTLPDAKRADADFYAEAKRRFGDQIQAPAPEAARPSAFVGSAGGAEAASTFAKVVESLKGFGSAIGGVLSALNPWKFLLEAVQRALGDFLVNMTPIVEILAAAFMPVLKALFPIFKLLAIAATYVGQVFFTIAGGILKAVGYLVKGLGALIAKLPGVGDFGLKKAGQAMIDLGNGFSEASSELGDARDKIRELEWKDAVDPLKEASDEAGEAVKKMAEGLRNVPEIWNANLARFRAAVSAGGAAVGGALTGGRTLAGGGGGVVIPDATFNFYGVQNVAQFRRELEAEVVRTAARGGAPVLVDANRRL